MAVSSCYLVLPIRCSILVVFFFFQAEDGIRDSSVTGVQTCALPISLREASLAWKSILARAVIPWPTGSRVAVRTGERRVGEERRTRWGRCHLKKKKKKMRIYFREYYVIEEIY